MILNKNTMNLTNDSYIPIKQAEISIKKFNDVGIPHHLGLLKNHKSNIVKSLALGDWDKVKKEEINATRVVKQLKNLMLEMDILRGSVDECDLDKFDELTMIGRQKAKEAIKEYLGKLLAISTIYDSRHVIMYQPLSFFLLQIYNLKKLQKTHMKHHIVRILIITMIMIIKSKFKLCHKSKVTLNYRNINCDHEKHV